MQIHPVEMDQIPAADGKYPQPQIQQPTQLKHRRNSSTSVEIDISAGENNSKDRFYLETRNTARAYDHPTPAARKYGRASTSETAFVDIFDQILSIAA
jgi:hypothetical protein